MFNKLQGRFLNNRKILENLSIVWNICSIIALLLAISIIFLPQSLLKIFIFLLLILFILLALIFTCLTRRIPFDDVDIRYDIDIHNREGDSLIERETTFVNNSKMVVQEREHVAYSGTEAMPWDGLKLKAWDNENHQLNIEKFRDEPTQKRFIIKFNKTIKSGSFYSYGYNFFWRKFMSVPFTAQDICPIINFLIKIPQDLKVMRLVCQELFADGRRIDCKELQREERNKGDKTEYLLKIAKIDRFNKVELLITYKHGV